MFTELFMEAGSILNENTGSICSMLSDSHNLKSFEFSLNYTKLRTKVYVQQSKINSVTKIVSSGDRTQKLLLSSLMP